MSATARPHGLLDRLRGHAARMRCALRPGLRPRARRTVTLGVRATASLTAAAVIAVAFALASLLMLVIMREVLISHSKETISAHVSEITAELSVRGTAGDLTSLLTGSSTVDIAQILTPDGRVYLGHPSTPLVPQFPPTGTLIYAEVRPPGVETDYLVAIETVETPSGPLVVAAGTDTGRTTTVLAVLLAMFALVWPLVVAGAAFATNSLVGRALRPVEDMRLQVQDITSSDLGGQIEVPATRDELARLAVTMNAMLERLEAGRAAQLGFVGDASHELRSPIATLSGILELARRENAGVDADTVRDVLEPEVERMRTLVEDLLTLARSDEQGLDLRRDEVDLDDIVASEARRLRVLGQVGVTMHLTPARVVGDATALTRLVRNLGDNAADFAAGEVQLTMRTGGADADGNAPRWVEVVVADDGPGIPPESRTAVFERFVRLDDHRDRTRGGAGLGLAIVAEILRAHTGTVHVEDSPLGGAAFVVRLPLAD